MIPGEGENIPRLNLLRRGLLLATVITASFMVMVRRFGKNSPADPTPQAFWILAVVGVVLVIGVLIIDLQIKRRAPSPLAQLRGLIDRFLAGDHSADLVFQIEGILIESFAGSDAYDLVADDLASYNPEQGQPRPVDTTELGLALDRAVRMLETRRAQRVAE